jgi:hypothetical protein
LQSPPQTQPRRRQNTKPSAHPLPTTPLLSLLTKQEASEHALQHFMSAHLIWRTPRGRLDVDQATLMAPQHRQASASKATNMNPHGNEPSPCGRRTVRAPEKLPTFVGNNLTDLLQIVTPSRPHITPNSGGQTRPRTPTTSSFLQPWPCDSTSQASNRLYHHSYPTQHRGQHNCAFWTLASYSRVHNPPHATPRSAQTRRHLSNNHPHSTRYQV